MKYVDIKLHVMHVTHKSLDVVCVLTDERHQILVRHDILQVLGVPRVLHVDLSAQNVHSKVNKTAHTDVMNLLSCQASGLLAL